MPEAIGLFSEGLLGNDFKSVNNQMEKYFKLPYFCKHGVSFPRNETKCNKAHYLAELS